MNSNSFIFRGDGSSVVVCAEMDVQSDTSQLGDVMWDCRNDSLCTSYVTPSKRGRAQSRDADAALYTVEVPVQEVLQL